MEIRLIDDEMFYSGMDEIGILEICNNMEKLIHYVIVLAVLMCILLLYSFFRDLFK